MRVPEISLVNELQAQNKHDLYRYHKYKREYQQTQYLTACTVSFMVVPSVRAWGFSKKKPWVSPYFSGRKKPDFQDICNGICEGACYGESCPGDLYH